MISLSELVAYALKQSTAAIKVNGIRYEGKLYYGSDNGSHAGVFFVHTKNYHPNNLFGCRPNVLPPDAIGWWALALDDFTGSWDEVERYYDYSDLEVEKLKPKIPFRVLEERHG